jgi:hypothetical protein
MANFALNYSFSRNLSIPLDEDAVKATLAEVVDYVATKGKCYAGQLFSVTGDTGNNGLYLALSKGPEGSIIKFPSQSALDEVAASAGKIDEIRINGSALTINDKIVNIDLSDYISVSQFNSGLTKTLEDAKSYTDTKLEDYATKSYVDDVLADIEGGEISLQGYAKVEDVKASGNTIYASAKTYTDSAIATASEDLNWILVDGEKQKVRNWRGTRANYELLAQNGAVSPWTRYVVIDTINGKEVITEYYGQNQVAEATGQLLPVKDIIGSISEITPQPYDRYLVGSDGKGYQIYEYVIDGEYHKWLIKPFDYRYGVRVIERGLKNYVYVSGILKTYDDVDCGSF